MWQALKGCLVVFGSQDADLIARGLVLYYRREPSSLMTALPRLEAGGPFDRMCLARACITLASTSQPIELDLISGVASILGDFIISLKSVSRMVRSSSPARMLLH